MRISLTKSIVAVLLIVLALFSFVGASAFAQCGDYATAAVKTPGDESTSAKAAVVMERNSGRILYQKNPNERLLMASTTKIATAITVLNMCDVSEVVVVPKAACGVEGSSVYLNEGEHLTVKELLLGLMLRSGNDCAVALALHASGSVEKFAEQMNALACSLGCENTHFVNPHGLHSENHFTSAADLAKITCYALKNPIFAEIVGTKVAKITNEFGTSSRILLNKNKLLKRNKCFDGVKTGYTKAAGRCFVGSMTAGDMQVVCVVLNCAPMFQDAERLLVSASERYKLQCVVPLGKVANGAGGYYVAEKSFYYPVCSGETLTKSICYSCNGASYQVKLNGTVLASVPLRFVCQKRR